MLGTVPGEHKPNGVFLTINGGCYDLAHEWSPSYCLTGHRPGTDSVAIRRAGCETAENVGFAEGSGIEADEPLTRIGMSAALKLAELPSHCFILPHATPALVPRLDRPSYQPWAIPPRFFDPASRTPRPCRAVWLALSIAGGSAV